MKYNVMYYDEPNCCEAEEYDEGEFVCETHSGWEVATTCDTPEEAEAIGMAFNMWDIEERVA